MGKSSPENELAMLIVETRVASEAVEVLCNKMIQIPQVKKVLTPERMESMIDIVRRWCKEDGYGRLEGPACLVAFGVGFLGSSDGALKVLEKMAAAYVDKAL